MAATGAPLCVGCRLGNHPRRRTVHACLAEHVSTSVGHVTPFSGRVLQVFTATSLLEPRLFMNSAAVMAAAFVSR